MRSVVALLRALALLRDVPLVVDRLCHAYGTEVETILAGVRSAADLGKDFVTGAERCDLDAYPGNRTAA
jgi:hypothetical protein